MINYNENEAENAPFMQNKAWWVFGLWSTGKVFHDSVFLFLQACDESLPIADPSPEQPEEILKLTIPLSHQGSAGLGISVKGRHSEGTEEDQGIYVKSVLKGGAAAKVFT